MDWNRTTEMNKKKNYERLLEKIDVQKLYMLLRKRVYGSIVLCTVFLNTYCS